MNSKKITTGCLFILAALTFWISWYLMPDPGTTDTPHILAIVKQTRISVLTSVIVQIISSVLYMIALFLLMLESYPRKKTSAAGFILLGIGAMGLCADAFFHLLAFFITDNSVDILQNDVVKVMTFMQTTGVVFLIPLLLPLFIGSLVLAIGLCKEGIISKTPKLIFITAFLLGIVSAIANKTQLYTGTAITLTVLALFAVGQAWIGFECINTKTKKVFAF